MRITLVVVALALSLAACADRQAPGRFYALATASGDTRWERSARGD
jgi:hypothetical protein